MLCISFYNKPGSLLRLQKHIDNFEYPDQIPHNADFRKYPGIVFWGGGKNNKIKNYPDNTKIGNRLIHFIKRKSSQEPNKKKENTIILVKLSSTCKNS